MRIGSFYFFPSSLFSSKHLLLLSVQQKMSSDLSPKNLCLRMGGMGMMHVPQRMNRHRPLAVQMQFDDFIK